MKILIIEDSKSIANYLAELLRKEDYIISVVNNGTQALELLNNQTFRLVLLDLNLPDIHGLDIIKSIRKTKNALQLPIIVLSATQDKEKIQEVLNLEANDFLNKPFDAITLLTKVKNLLQLQKLNEKSIADAVELKQSEKQLNAIFDFSPTAMFVTDNNARILKLNKSAESFTNKTFKDVYKKLAGDVIQCIYAISKPESCGTHEACKVCGLRTSVIETIKNQNEIYKRKGHFSIKKNGAIEKLTLNISTALIKLDTDQLVLLNIDDISRDEKYIAEIKETNDQLNAQAEELLQITEYLDKSNKLLSESETLFKTITKYAQDAIILIDTNDKIKIWNKAAEKIFGYMATEVENKELHSIIIPDEYIETFRKGFAMFKHSGKGNAIGRTVELKGKRKDGNTFPAEISISAITINNELHAVGIVRDITSKKQYETVLREKERQLRQILEYQPIPICLSKGTELIYMNQKFKNFFGYTIEEVPNWDNWFLKAYPDETYRNWALQTFVNDVELNRDNPQNVSHQVYKITPKSGNEKHIEVSFSFLDDIIIGSFIDITQRVENQQKLKELNATKDKFVSILAHDLKNPFNSILGFGDLLLKNNEKYDSAKREKMIKSLVNSAKNTYQLLENLLEWSRSQQNKIPFKVENSDLYMLAYESSMIIYNLAQKKSITINNNIQKNEFIDVDKEMIKTVFRNLITNAIKFTPENGIVSISSQRNHETIKIEVNDTGIGMDEKTKNSLFKIGETKSIEGTNGEQGTGLGLLLCKGFIDKHNGTISIESEPNRGSRFIITLPIKQDNDMIMNN